MITKRESLKDCETFGDILRFYRIEKKITITDFSQEVEMFKENVSAIEKGSRKPPAFDVIKNMACALDLNKHEQLEFYKWAFTDRLFPEQLEHYRIIQETFKDLKDIDFDAPEIDPHLEELAELVANISPRTYKTLIEMIRQFLRED